MKYELYAPMYILFIRLAGGYIESDKVEGSLNNFLNENIDIDKGISKEYILDTLRQAFIDGEACNVKLVGKEVVIEKCLDWIERNREESSDTFILTYERLFKNPNDCARITKIILEKGCMNGLFKGFEGVSSTPKNQLLIAYDIIKERFLRTSLADTHGTKETSKQLFYERFGWEGYRAGRPKGKNAVSLRKTAPQQTKNYPNAKRDIELILV
jgi:hypothetical protein